MTAAAAAAILAFTSSVAAYYPTAYDSSLYARDAYAEAEPEDFDLFERDAEPDAEPEAEPEAEADPEAEAYLSGYEAGLEARDTDDFYELYARGLGDSSSKGSKSSSQHKGLSSGGSHTGDLLKGLGGLKSSKHGLIDHNGHKSRGGSKKHSNTDLLGSSKLGMSRVNSHEAKLMKEQASDKKDLKRLQRLLMGKQGELKSDRSGIAKDEKKSDMFRQQMLQNSKRDVYDYDW